MYIVAGNYTTPPSTESISSFKVSIIRNGSPMQIGSTTLTPLPTTLTAALTSRSSDIVNKNTTYVFTITTSDPMSSTGKIRVKFPPEMTILATSQTCATLSGTNLSTVNPTCIINTTTNSIDFTNLNTSTNNIIAQTFTLSIDGIRNQPSNITSGTFEISSFYYFNDTSLVAIGTANGVSANAFIIDPGNVVITTSSYKVLDTNVSYYIQLKNDN